MIEKEEIGLIEMDKCGLMVNKSVRRDFVLCDIGTKTRIMRGGIGEEERQKNTKN